MCNFLLKLIQALDCHTPTHTNEHFLLIRMYEGTARPSIASTNSSLIPKSTKQLFFKDYIVLYKSLALCKTGTFELNAEDELLQRKMNCYNKDLPQVHDNSFTKVILQQLSRTLTS